MKKIKPISLLISTIFFALKSYTQDLSLLYEKLNPSVVVIHTIEKQFQNGRQGSQESLGSGFLISNDGLIITAAHVVQEADAIIVTFTDGQQLAAEVISTVPLSDVALIRVKNKINNPTPVPLGNSDSIKTGAPVFIIGAPLGLAHSLSVGHLSGRLKREQVAGGFGVAEFLQTDASINHGNSGGPMFNDKGEVIGIVSYILSQSGGFEGIGFASSINIAKQMLLNTPAFWTGFDGVFLDEELSALLNVPQKGGVLVQHVASNSSVAKMGLKAGTTKVNLRGKNIWIGGDIILDIQGQTCSGPHDFTSIRKTVDNLKNGESFTIHILRAGKIIELKSAFIK